MAPGRAARSSTSPSTYGAYEAMRVKIDDFFQRVQLADMDPGQAAPALNPTEAEMHALVDTAAFPLTRVAARRRPAARGAPQPRVA